MLIADCSLILVSSVDGGIDRSATVALYLNRLSSYSAKEKEKQKDICLTGSCLEQLSCNELLGSAHETGDVA